MDISDYERGYAEAYRNERPALRRLFFGLGVVVGWVAAWLIL